MAKKTNQSAKLAIMCRHPFFEGLPDEIGTHLVKHIVSKSYPKNTVIFSKGDPGDALLLINRGSVMIGAQSREGRDAVFRLLKQGEFFGEIALLDGLPRTADAYAHTNCELLVIYRRDLIPIIEAYPPLMWRLLRILCTRLRKTTEQVEDLMFIDLAGRLAHTLLELSSFSHEPGRILATQSEIARIAGLSREMTNKQLQIWAKRNWIALGRKELVLSNIIELSKIASSAQS